MVVLRGKHVLLRTGRPEDADMLIRIRKEPEVARRWGSAHIEEEIGEGFMGTDEGFVIEVNGGGRRRDQVRRGGRPDVPPRQHGHLPRHVPPRTGVGDRSDPSPCRHLFEERGHHRLTIDPATDNAAAIRAYEKAGFRRGGIMRSYERGPYGVWHDGLLMDMLEGELRS